MHYKIFFIPGAPAEVYTSHYRDICGCGGRCSYCQCIFAHRDKGKTTWGIALSLSMSALVRKFYQIIQRICYIHIFIHIPCFISSSIFLLIIYIFISWSDLLPLSSNSSVWLKHCLSQQHYFCVSLLYIECAIGFVAFHCQFYKIFKDYVAKLIHRVKRYFACKFKCEVS